MMSRHPNVAVLHRQRWGRAKYLRSNPQKNQGSDMIRLWYIDIWSRHRFVFERYNYNYKATGARNLSGKTLIPDTRSLPVFLLWYLVLRDMANPNSRKLDLLLWLYLLRQIEGIGRSLVTQVPAQHLSRLFCRIQLMRLKAKSVLQEPRSLLQQVDNHFPSSQLKFHLGTYLQ